MHGHWSVRSRPPSTAAREVDASGDTQGLLDAATPTNRNTDQSSITSLHNSGALCGFVEEIQKA